nr:uncharacterized protein LOC107449190 isoform X6 [Parasteatoda tepidariorum]
MEMKKCSQRKKGRKADPESREVFTRLYRYLKDRMFEHIIVWENEEKGDFFINYINLRNPISSSFFELFIAMDSISPVKEAKYRKSPKFYTEAKKRFRSNIQKLIKDKYLVERKFPPLSENLKSTKSKFRTCRYTFLKFPKSCKVQHMENIDLTKHGTKKSKEDHNIEDLSHCSCLFKLVLYAPTTVEGAMEGAMYASTAPQVNAGREMCASTAAQANAGREMCALTAAQANAGREVCASTAAQANAGREMCASTAAQAYAGREMCASTAAQANAGREMCASTAALVLEHGYDIMVPILPSEIFSDVDIGNIMDWEDMDLTQLEEYLNEDSTDASPEELIETNPMQSQFSSVWKETVTSQFEGYPSENSTDASPEQLTNGDPMWCQTQLSSVWNETVMRQFEDYPCENSMWCLPQLSLDTSLYD